MRTASALVRPALAAALLTVAACSESGQPISIDATGSVVGQAVLDRDGNEQLDPKVDAATPHLKVALLRPDGETVDTATTDASGVVRFGALPVGSYRLTATPDVLGDSLRVVAVDSAQGTVNASDTAYIRLTLGYPIVTSAQLATLPVGRFVILRGVALHSADAFGDRTLSVSDGAGAARLARLPAGSSVVAGDTLRVLGRVGTYLGRPAVFDPRVTVVAHGEVAAAKRVGAAVAASAQAGKLDGALVRVAGARVVSSARASTGDVRLRVADDTGVLDVLLDRDAKVRSGPALPAGVEVDVTGILFPREGSTTEWYLKPRSSEDFTADVPTETAAGIRELSPGTLVDFSGVALNGLAAYGDNSAHFADRTGAIRVTGISPTFLFAGDSARVLGIVKVAYGQRVLTQAAVEVLGKATARKPRDVATATAAKADAGALDAALVRVRGARIVAITPLGSGDVRLQVDDGSGPLLVVLDRDTGIDAGLHAVGDTVSVTGLLVPVSTTTWVLAPRAPADVTR